MVRESGPDTPATSCCLLCSRCPVTSAHFPLSLESVIHSDFPSATHPPCRSPSSIGAGRSLQSFIDYNPDGDCTSNDRSGEQQPAPVLSRVPEHTDELMSIMVSKDGDERIAQSPAEQDYGEVFPGRVSRSTCGGEEYAGGEKRNGSGHDESPGPPPFEQSLNTWHAIASELAVQICNTRPARQPERDICSNQRPRCRNGCILVPWVVMTRS